jgi:hypothetical protein
MALAQTLTAWGRQEESYSSLIGAGVAMQVLLPLEREAVPVPDWVRAEEMLEETAACPGERLFARTLSSAVEWRSVADIASAAVALGHLVLAGGVRASDASAEAVVHGCTMLATAASALPAACQARVSRE